MEDYSDFITEEIFLLDIIPSVKNDTKEHSESATYSLSAITGYISKEEKNLLENILSALKLPNKDVLRADEVNIELCQKWIIFDTSYQVGTTQLDFNKPTEIQNTTYILAKPLSVLLKSQEEKLKLWEALKELFEIQH